MSEKKNVWRDMFLDCDENGDPVNNSTKIKSDGQVNTARANRIKALNPEFREKLKDRASEVSKRETVMQQRKTEGLRKQLDEDFKLKMKKVNQNTRENPDWHQKLMEGINNQDRAGWYQKILESAEKRKGNPELSKKMKEVNLNTSLTNQNWIDSRERAIKNANRSRAKPLKYFDQPFLSIREASRAFGVDAGTIRNWLTKCKEGWTYITLEEYDQLIESK